MRNSILVLFAAFVYLCGCAAPEVKENRNEFPVLTGDYLGQKPPAMKAEMFAPGIVSMPFNVRDMAMTPDGNEMYYSISARAFIYIACVKRVDGKWTKPEIAPFSGTYKDIEPYITPDGKKMFFCSNRPLEGAGEPEEDFDIWYMERVENGWGEPVRLSDEINSDKGEFYPTMTNDGTLYFTASYDDAIGGEDLYSSKLVDGKYGKPVNLGDSINTKAGEYNSFVSPDGSFIMYNSEGLGEGVGGGDMWISFRNEDGSWGKAVNMGEKVNSTYFEYCPSLSPDGKYLFFTSNRTDMKSDHTKKRTYEEVKELLNQPGNSSRNIFWISAAVINELR